MTVGALSEEQGHKGLLKSLLVTSLSHAVPFMTFGRVKSFFGSQDCCLRVLAYIWRKIKILNYMYEN